MKNKSKELDVDFIGVQSKPLTKEEQLSISAFIRHLKVKRSRTTKQKNSKLEKLLA